VNHCKPRELGVASANHHSRLGSHEVPARPWFCGSTKKPSTDFILLFLPPCGPHLTLLATGSLERSLLVFSTPGGLTSNDLLHLFFTCTNTNQAATCTAILSQESVHTMLSITRHTRKRPFTGPRTTHGPQRAQSAALGCTGRCGVSWATRKGSSSNRTSGGVGGGWLARDASGGASLARSGNGGQPARYSHARGNV
jgi:hypothetical protein